MFKIAIALWDCFIDVLADSVDNSSSHPEPEAHKEVPKASEEYIWKCALRRNSPRANCSGCHSGVNRRRLASVSRMVQPDKRKRLTYPKVTSIAFGYP